MIQVLEGHVPHDIITQRSNLSPTFFLIDTAPRNFNQILASSSHAFYYLI